MAELEIEIGGRAFKVACQEGEEAFLKSAAALLDAEASALVNQIGRMPETRMLLMAGLMLADRTADFEDRAKVAEAKLAEPAAPVEPQEVRVEVPVIPESVTDNLSAMAERAEMLAALAEEKTSA
ncbi:MAG: cell division protein ZapA [Pseudomonadota bacterium]